jgi:hypothetical protein
MTMIYVARVSHELSEDLFMWKGKKYFYFKIPATIINHNGL